MDRILALVRHIRDFVASLSTSPSGNEGTYAEMHYIDPGSFSNTEPMGMDEGRETIRQYMDDIEGRPQDD